MVPYHTFNRAFSIRAITLNLIILFICSQLAWAAPPAPKPQTGEGKPGDNLQSVGDVLGQDAILNRAVEKRKHIEAMRNKHREQPSPFSRRKTEGEEDIEEILKEAYNKGVWTYIPKPTYEAFREIAMAVIQDGKEKLAEQLGISVDEIALTNLSTGTLTHWPIGNYAVLNVVLQSYTVTFKVGKDLYYGTSNGSGGWIERDGSCFVKQQRQGPERNPKPEPKIERHPAELAARDYLADKLGVKKKDITIIGSENLTFLSMNGLVMTVTGVMTRLVLLEYQGKTYYIECQRATDRRNAPWKAIREISPSDPLIAGLTARAYLADALGVDKGDIRVTDSEDVTPRGLLGAMTRVITLEYQGAVHYIECKIGVYPGAQWTVTREISAYNPFIAELTARRYLANVLGVDRGDITVRDSEDITPYGMAGLSMRVVVLQYQDTVHYIECHLGSHFGAQWTAVRKIPNHDPIMAELTARTYLACALGVDKEDISIVGSEDITPDGLVGVMTRLVILQYQDKIHYIECQIVVHPEGQWTVIEENPPFDDPVIVIR
ncbi:MAG: hypothetical protein JW844_04935 [Candidatus Omnitrophica bacterium]|nr:hypothetical protein [Candidatus Omnitrophota bacterium]